LRELSAAVEPNLPSGVRGLERPADRLASSLGRTSAEALRTCSCAQSLLIPITIRYTPTMVVRAVITTRWLVLTHAES